MIAIVVAGAIAFAGPGPIDAFRANFSAIKAEVDYVYVSGHMDGSVVASGRLWSERDLGLAEDHDSRVIGRWATDGTVEYYSFGSPDEQLQRGKLKPKERLESENGIRIEKKNYLPRIEALWDGKTLAGHTLGENPVDESMIRVWTSGDPGYLVLSKGPFYWWGPHPFPRYLWMQFPGVEPARRVSRRGGHRVEVETYRSDRNSGWAQVEVSYDPAVGFLPRYLRMVSFRKKGKTHVRETYLTDARMCAAGGFVPTEWYETDYAIEGFGGRYPDYDEDTILSPPGKVFAGHFKVTRMADRTAPMSFARLKGVRSIGAIGGTAGLGGRTSLTISDIKSVMGRKLDTPAVAAMPSLDADELHKYDARPGHGWYWYLGGAAVIFVAVGATARRRFGAALALACAAGTAGCGHVGEPVTKLTAAFTRTRLLLDDADAGFVPLTLVLRNDGNRPLQIFGADGGCSCRRIEKTSFPIRLGAGETRPLKVDIQNSRAELPQNVAITFETDRGSIPVPVSLYALHRYKLDPDSPSHTSLEEDNPWEFDLVQRVLFETGKPRPATALVVPPELAATELGRRTGRVGGAPEFSYEDTTYLVRLNDLGLGLHKAVIYLKGPDGGKVADSTVVWDRAPFLSTTPERVYLGLRAARVFLRCRDERVEFTKVEKAPPGVKVALAAARELTVDVAEEAPAVLDGVIEVGTTADGRPPLRIPIVRYTQAAAE